MPTLPRGLKPVCDGYQMDEPGGVMRTEIEGGASRYAMQWDRGPQRFAVTLILDSEQFSVWSVFYLHIIKKGALSFDMPLDSGMGTSPHNVTIMPGSYSAARTGGIMTVVTFSAEAESQVYSMTATEAETMIDVYNLYGDGAHALFNALFKFANVDSNALSLA